MARKLSGVARQQLIIGFPLAVAAGLHSALTAPAEDTVRAIDQPAVIQNPFSRPHVGERMRTATATPSNSSAAAPRTAETAGPARTGEAAAGANGGAQDARVAMVPAASPRIHTNPFARQAPSAPPLEIPILPGAISRWRQPVRPSGEGSKLDGAFVADETKPVGAPDDDAQRENSNVPWDRLPPAELLRARHAESLPAPQRKAHARPGSISFSAANLHQPQWMVPDIQKTASAAQNAAPSGERSDDFDPFESPKREATEGEEEPKAFVAMPSGDGAEIVSARPAPIEPDMTSVVVSEYVDTAEGWQARAQQSAQVAQTSDDLSAVIQDCRRAIQAGADVEIARRVNRLAAWAYNRRGELAVENGLEQEALDDFQSALALDPECWLALHNRGVTLAQQRDLGAALQDFNRVIELNPGLAVAYRNRAELLAALGRMEDALSDYDTAIEQLPDDAGLRLGRAYALHRLGKYDRALVDLNRAIELGELLPEAYTQRGNLHAERGEFPAAIKDLETALQLDPTFVEAHRSAAWLLATCPDGAFRDQAQALAAAQQALALGSDDDPILLETLAAAHANAGQFEEAARVQQRAIEAAQPEISALLEDRLQLYQQGKAFRSGSSSAVQTASHMEQTRGERTEVAR